MQNTILVLLLSGFFLFACSEKKEEEKKETASKCAAFKNGKFQGTGVQSEIFIERNDSVQFEYTPYGDVVLKVDWISDCEYDLTIVKPMNDSMANQVGKVYHINITEVTEDSYSYECKSEGSEFTSTGTYKKID